MRWKTCWKSISASMGTTKFWSVWTRPVKQQVKETRRPRPARPGAAGSYDYEYERNGVSNLFMLFAPLEGWRRVEVTDRRTKADWARVVKQLVDEDYPHKDRIVLVMDNLNTHHPASLYEAFEPAEARRIAERLEVHYTPKHGSWLDMAEIEIGVMARQCLNRRIPDQSALRREVGAWQQQRNRDAIRVDWRFIHRGLPASSSSPSTHQYNTDGLLELTGQIDGENRKLSSNAESSGRFHTDWLNMVYPRIKIARNVLANDGLIAVSCDDTEVGNLRMVLDEVFGEEQFQAQIIIQSNKRGQTYKQISKTHEFLVLYSKSEVAELNELDKSDDALPFSDSLGPFDLWELRNRNPKFGRFNRPNLFFPIYVLPKSLDECGYARVSLEPWGG